MTRTVIEIVDLWFSYNGTPVLKDVNLSVKEGDFLAIIGPNGGGKTTLVKLILGLLKPRKGIIRVLGEKPLQAVPMVGYVPQDIHFNKSFPITAFNTVLMGVIKGGGGFKRFSQKDRETARQALERVGMWGYRDRQMGDLSGGQRQRVFMARAIVSNPKILLLDEPTSSVDTKGQTEFYEFLKEINNEVTIVVVSHDIMVLSSYVKSVACVSRDVHFHDAPEVTQGMIEQAYHCPVELVAHGLPHRVLKEHLDE